MDERQCLRVNIVKGDVPQGDTQSRYKLLFIIKLSTGQSRERRNRYCLALGRVLFIFSTILIAPFFASIGLNRNYRDYFIPATVLGIMIVSLFLAFKAAHKRA